MKVAHNDSPVPPFRVAVEQRRANSSRMRTLVLGVCVLFLLLGVGNYSYGYAKGKYYSNLNSIVAKERLAQKAVGSIPFLDTSLKIDKEAEYRERLKTRRDFYQIVRVGGVVFTCVSLVLFSVWLFMRDMKEGEQNE